MFDYRYASFHNTGCEQQKICFKSSVEMFDPKKFFVPAATKYSQSSGFVFPHKSRGEAKFIVIPQLFQKFQF